MGSKEAKFIPSAPLQSCHATRHYLQPSQCVAESGWNFVFGSAYWGAVWEPSVHNVKCREFE